MQSSLNHGNGKTSKASFHHLKDGLDTLTSEQASYFFKHAQSTGSHE
jgi:hypothetical protein